MSSLLSRYATPLTTGLFLVSLVSGIALFFHLGAAAFHGMHEWLSMALIAPFLLHVWKNWRPFLAYFRRLPMALALGLSLAAGFAFAWPSLTDNAGAGANPALTMIGIIAARTPAEVAPLLDRTGIEVVAALKEGGFTAADAATPLSEIATASGKTSMALMATLVAIKPK